MTEMDQLKKNADEAKAKQKIDELNQFLLDLSQKLDYEFAKEKKSWDIYLVCWLIWVLLGVFKVVFRNEWWAILIDQLGFFIFISGWLYSFYWGRMLARTAGRFYGAYKILFLLGHTDWDPDEPRNRKRLKLGAWEEAISMVKGWAESKKKAQDAVYQPA